MKKKYGTLHRNLDELETQIRSIFWEEASEEGQRQRYMAEAEDIERKLGFVKSHMAAEFSSPEQPEHHHHLARRLETIHSAVVALTDNLLHGLPLHSPHFDSPTSSCGDESSSSCCLHEGLQDGDDAGPVPVPVSSLKVYDNPLYNDHGDDDDDETTKGVQGELAVPAQHLEEEEEEEMVGRDGVIEEEQQQQVEEREEKAAATAVSKYGWVRMVAGGVTGAATAVSLIILLHGGVECRFGGYNDNSITVFPRPT